MHDITPGPIAAPDDAERRRLRWFVYWLLIAMAGGLGTASILRVEPLLSANDRSRWCTVRALVDEDTYQIDNVILDPNWDTIDKVRHRVDEDDDEEERHFYSSKPALLPMLVAEVYRAVQQISDQFDGDGENENGWTLEKNTAETTRAILIIINLLPMLVALFVFALILERYAERDVTRIFVMAAAALGTLLTTFLVTLNNHNVAAYSLVFALYPAMRILTDGERKWYWFALCGFFAAFVCTNELPAALFGVLMFGLLCRASPRQTLAFFVPAALIPLGAYFYANYEATGGFIPFYAYYGTEKYEYVYKGVPSYWMNPGGIDANEEPPWKYFIHCTVGHHGLLSLSPIFLLTLAGWGGTRRSKQFRATTFLWLGMGLTVIVLGFYLTRTANYNYGGNTAGLRWMFWLIPFWLIGMIPVFDAWGHRRWFRGLSIGLLIVSVFSSTYSLSNPWKKPWLFALLERWEYIEYGAKSEKPRDEPKMTTWFRSLPKSSDPDNPEWIRFEGFDAIGSRIELTLTDRGVSQRNGKTIHHIEKSWKQTGYTELKVTYDIDVAAFNAGKRPAHFLVGIEGESRGEALTFLRGMPKPRGYSIGSYRHVVAMLRAEREIFGCRKAAARVDFQVSKTDPKNWYRCDTWLSDRVPFGVVQFVITVRDGETDEILAARHMIAVAASSIKE